MAKLTIDQIMEAVESGDDMGFCIACGAEAYGVEPECGKEKVYGAEELLMMVGA